MEIALGSLQREKAEVRPHPSPTAVTPRSRYVSRYVWVRPPPQWEELRGHLTSENTKISARLLEAQSELDGERRERARRESGASPARTLLCNFGFWFRPRASFFAL